MNHSFEKFKKRLILYRILRATMLGCACGVALSGLALLLSKRNILPFEPAFSILIGLCAMLVVFGIVFLLGKKSDSELARELDETFGLSARVATMVEYSGEKGDMLDMQRQDADERLSEIPLSKFKFKRLWVCIVALLLSAAMLAIGVISENLRGYVPPEEVEPFELSALQEASLRELINYVSSSALEEEFKTPMVAELESLIGRLKACDTKPGMQTILVESMAVLVDITYESSTETEMLNAIWDSGEINFRYLARVLYSGDKSSANWGDFAEGLAEYIGILLGDNETDESAAVGAERLKWALDSMIARLDVVLQSSSLEKDDEMYIAVENFFRDPTRGIARLQSTLKYMTDEEARNALTTSLDAIGEDTFAAISLNRANAAVGEYTMTRLAALFGVPLPQFERPEFIKKNLAPDGSQITEDDKDNQGSHGGGLGPGATFGSDDLVLNPLTGKYVKFGELLNSYNALMFEKLEGDLYSEEMKTLIRNYFDLLYRGLDEEGK
jgi:hypothetical protein